MAWFGAVDLSALQERDWRLDTALQGGLVTRSTGSHVSVLRAVVRRPRHPRAVLALYGERVLNRDKGGPFAKEKECTVAKHRRAGGSSEVRA